jgi:hypothetical protein
LGLSTVLGAGWAFGFPALVCFFGLGIKLIKGRFGQLFRRDRDAKAKSGGPDSAVMPFRLTDTAGGGKICIR